MNMSLIYGHEVVTVPRSGQDAHLCAFRRNTLPQGENSEEYLRRLCVLCFWWGAVGQVRGPLEKAQKCSVNNWWNHGGFDTDLRHSEQGSDLPKAPPKAGSEPGLVPQILGSCPVLLLSDQHGWGSRRRRFLVRKFSVP